MARPATAECHMCHFRHPKPTMYEKTISYVTGGSERTYYNKRGEYSGRSKTQSRTKYKAVWVCENCIEQFNKENEGIWNYIKNIFIRELKKEFGS